MGWLLEKPLLLKYPASKVDFVLVGADMKSALPMRQSLQAAANVPGELWRLSRIRENRLAIRRPRGAMQLRAAQIRR